VVPCIFKCPIKGHLNITLANYLNLRFLSLNKFGTGKTFVSFLLSLDYKNIFILTPLISTTEQILIHYKNYYSKYVNTNYISVNRNGERDINNIKLNDNKNIIASTYDSSDVIWKLLKTTNIDDNLIIVDEFHNLSQDMIINKKNNML